MSSIHRPRTSGRVGQKGTYNPRDGGSPGLHRAPSIEIQRGAEPFRAVANRRGSRIVPLTLGIAMLAVVLAAGLFPNAGTVQAQSSCPYGGCSTSSSIPVWEYVSILVVIAAGAIVALLFIMRRRRPPRAPATVTPWAGPPAGAAPAAPPTPPYIETPEDVGRAPPTVTPQVPPAAPAAGAAAGAESGSDIDSLMAELDKISTEILKKAPKKGAEEKEGGEAGGETDQGGS